MTFPGIILDEEVLERVDRLDISFNRYGIDPYGIDREYVAAFFSLMKQLYRHYLRVTVTGIEQVPAEGRAMLVGNHSGGVALDGAMVLTSLILDREPPRLGMGMAEKFINRFPVMSPVINKIGQLTGLPEHAVRLLRDGRMLMVFPEGARGTSKLYTERYSLVRFGTGFMRLALQTRTPIVPLAFVGGGDAIPTIANLTTVGKLMGLPYLPVTPWGLVLPRPVRCSIHYGAPMVFEGDGDEADEVILGYVGEVKQRVADLLAEGRGLPSPAPPVEVP